jgi:LmbE family N-acetylglucosaminyl deacetylase
VRAPALRLVLAALAGLTGGGAEVIVVVTPHGADYIKGAGATIAKAAREGAAVYVVRVTNDEKHGGKLPVHEARVRIYGETRKAAAILGVKEVIDLNLKDGEVAEVQEPELRGRLAALFRQLGPDALFTSDPWALYDPDLDDVKVGRAAEDAAWSAGSSTFYPELLFLKSPPYRNITDRYFWAVNHAWHPRTGSGDLSAAITVKMQALRAMPTAMGAEAAKAAARAARRAVSAEQVDVAPYIERYRGPDDIHHYQARDPLDEFRRFLAGQPQSEPGAEKPAPLELQRGGKALVITPAAPQFVVSAGGTVARMAAAGFEIGVVRVTDDSKTGCPAAAFAAAARALGAKQVFELGFRQGELESQPALAVRDRLLWILRSFQPDTVIAPDAWQRYSDRESVITGRITADAIYHMLDEAAAPEQSELTAHALPVRDILYWQQAGARRYPESVNRVSDIAGQRSKKQRAILALRAWVKTERELARRLLRSQGLPETPAGSPHRFIELRYGQPLEWFHADLAGPAPR